MAGRLVLAVVVALVSGGLAVGAQQGAAAKKLFLRASPFAMQGIRVVYLSKNTTATIAGDPVANGASFHIGFPGGDADCLSLPSSRWEVIPGGFKYRDTYNVSGSVSVAIVRRSATGRFRLKLTAKHLDFFLPDPATAYFTNFKINGGGDEYCASTGSATPTKNDEFTFLVRNDDGTACQAACSSPSGAFVDAATMF